MVLMDMVLPGINGVEAIRRIRAQGVPHGAIAIVGLSGRDEDEKAALLAGADAFILKPVSPRTLVRSAGEGRARPFERCRVHSFMMAALNSPPYTKTEAMK